MEVHHATKHPPDSDTTIRNLAFLDSLPDHMWVRLRGRLAIQRRLRISLVDHCNLSCFFCHNEGQGPIKKSSPIQLSVSEIIALTKVAISQGVDDIKLTGGEPLLYRSDDGEAITIVEEINKIRSSGAQFQLSMTTNGTLLPRYAHQLAVAGLDRVTISLTTMDWRTFSEFISANSLLLRKSVSGVVEAQSAGLTPVKINVPLYYSRRRKFGNLYEIPNIVSFAAERGVNEVRFFTLLSHGDFRTFQEYYQFFSPEMRESLVRCLVDFGIESPTQTVAKLTQLGSEFSRYSYPKVEFGVNLGNTRIGFEPMRYRRADPSVSDQEGPYAIRVGADGGLRTALNRNPDYRFIDALRSRSSDGDLKEIYRDTQEEMP